MLIAFSLPSTPCVEKLVWTRLDSSGLVWTCLDSSGLALPLFIPTVNYAAFFLTHLDWPGLAWTGLD